MNKALLSVPVLAGGLMFAQPNPLKPAYDFSLPQADKIKLAESAAPREVSGEATVYVLEHTGYVKTREASNGFSCFVDRQTPWNSEPTCFFKTQVTRSLQFFPVVASIPLFRERQNP